MEICFKYGVIIQYIFLKKKELFELFSVFLYLRVSFFSGIINSIKSERYKIMTNNEKALKCMKNGMVR